MTAELLTAEQVAARLGISENAVKRRTATEKWPCVRFSAKTIRYRAEHVEQIIQLHEQKAGAATNSFGQTERSRGRSA